MAVTLQVKSKKDLSLMKSLFDPFESEVKTRRQNAASCAKPKSILESFEYIVELAENSNLDKDFFDKAASQIRYASRKLHLSAMQTVLLALFVDRSEDQRITMSEVAGYTGCRTTRFLRLAKDIDVLESKHYLRSSRSGRSVTYRVPVEVLRALQANRQYEYVYEPVNGVAEFFDRFDKLMDEKRDGELTHDALLSYTDNLLEDIADSAFYMSLKRSELGGTVRLLFIYMAHLYVENNDDNINFDDIENIFDNDEIPRYIKCGMRSRRMSLFDKGLIENVNEDGMARSDAFKLTDKAKTEVLGELDLNRAAKSDAGLIKYDTLAEKKLIYNPAEVGQVEELASILTQERFSGVQTRLRKAGMRPGFCCIFYGAPGTGKTETVYQLARQTGRHIMRVDVDKIKSCWVGESEKNIKAIFDRYRNICKGTELAPILLFNEADAVLGVRMEGAARAVDKMENSIQNIILQEMETLEGIMIATTNLTTNLDKAFERRFLYKIRFDKPTIDARKRIWMSMIPELNEEDASILASQFDLSGGEIENIVRKLSVNAILSGDEEIKLSAIIEICLHERISATHRSVGFSTPA